MSHKDDNVVLRIGVTCAKLEKLCEVPSIELYEQFGATLVLNSDRNKTLHIPLTSWEQVVMLHEHSDNLILEIRIDPLKLDGE